MEQIAALNPSCDFYQPHLNTPLKEQTRKERSSHFRHVRTRKGSSILQQTSLIPEKSTSASSQTPCRITSHYQSDSSVARLVGNPVKQLVPRNEASLSFSKHTHIKRQSNLFSTPGHIHFLRWINNQSLFSFYITVSPRNPAVQSELMNINGWLSIPFEQKTHTMLWRIKVLDNGKRHQSIHHICSTIQQTGTFH